MAKYTAESKFIASIYPGKLERLTRSHGTDPNPRSGRCTVYWIPPVSRHTRPGWKTLEVPDAFENILDVPKSSETRGKVWASSPVSCEEIIQDILTKWTGNMVGVPEGAAPGVMQIVGTVPTTAELAHLKAIQTNYFEWRFQQGEELHKKNQWNLISETMRDAAIWLGHERIWASPEQSSNTIKCPECKQLIPADATTCFQCHAKFPHPAVVADAKSAKPELLEG